MTMIFMTAVSSMCWVASDAVQHVAKANSGNKNGVPRTQSMTEFGGRRCPDLSCGEYFVLHSRRIHVDPMARLNAKPVPVVRNAREKAVAWGFAANGTHVRRARRATRFDAARHMDGATQHPARARCGPASGARCDRRRRYLRGVARRTARFADGWLSPCVSRGEFMAATQPPRHARTPMRAKHNAVFRRA